MTTETITLNLYQKLIEVRKLVTYLQKDKTSTQFKYVANSQVLLALRSKMDELGLLLVPSVTGHNVRESVIEIPNEKFPDVVAKRTTTYFTEMDMSYTWINADNPSETLTAPWYAQGVDIAGEKGVGKAATYGEKYFLLKFFNIPTDLDDPDAFHNQPPDSAPVTPTATSGSLTVSEPKAPTANSNITVTPTTGTPAALVTEGQVKLLNGKATAAGFKKEHKDDLMEALTIIIGRPIVSMNEIRKAEVDKVIKWLTDYTQTSTAKQA